MLIMAVDTELYGLYITKLFIDANFWKLTIMRTEDLGIHHAMIVSI